MAEAQETSDFPGALDTFVTLTDKEDLSEASDLNKIKAAILAVQTELGVNVAGSLATLLARLAMIQNVDGAIQKGTAFPSSGLVDGQAFYRTDENVLYIYNGSTWDSQGQSLSNVIFAWRGVDASSQDGNTGYGKQFGTSSTPSVLIAEMDFFVTRVQTTYRDLIPEVKWKKIAGVSTLTFLVRAWSEAAETFTLKAIANTLETTLAVSATQTTPSWRTAITIDVSSLTDGTTYDLKVQVVAASATRRSIGLSGIVILGS